jgi:DNA polymerase III epsilon subunit-like protein
MTEKTTFEGWCIVELMGHNQIAGKVSEKTMAGTTLLRVDVPTTDKRPAYTKFFGGAAIYAITPVEQSVAVAMAEALNEPPIQEWRLRTVEPAKRLTGPDAPSYSVALEEGDSFASDFVPPDPPDWEGVEADLEKDKAAAVEWARDLLAIGDFVIVDTETTGFDAHDEVIQIGVVDQDGKVLLETLIKPGQSIKNHLYHGITDEMVNDAPSFPEIFEKLQAAFKGKKVLAYNWDYDSKMINQMCRKHELPVWGDDGECVMEMYAQFNGEWDIYHGNYRWKKLRDALAALGLKHEDFGEKEHDACTDARATLAVIKKMAEWTPAAG